MNEGSFEAVTHITNVTHLWCLILLSRQAPPTMPSMSSTPITPAAKPPRNRPTPVALLESLLKFVGLTPSASTAMRARDLAQMNLLYVHWSCYCGNVKMCTNRSVFLLSLLTIPSIHIICRSKVVGSFSIILYTKTYRFSRDIKYANILNECRFVKYKRYNSTTGALNIVNSKTVSRNHPKVTHKVHEIFRQSMAL